MKLLNDFFQLVTIDVKHEDITATVHMNHEHSIYHAHFPGNPITPGVCLVQMSTELLEIGIEKSLKLITAVKIKFKNPMGPNVQPTFLFRKINLTETQVSVLVSVQDEKLQYATMNLIYNIID